MDKVVQTQIDPAFNNLPNRNIFYCRKGKRVLDVFLAGAGLLCTIPIFAMVSLLIKVFSPGPLFFLQERVGKDGQIFRIIKFRSMKVDAETKGLGITCAGDSRITQVGKFLRYFKIDELPQLWNVCKGDMSLVGPRPELPRYVIDYLPWERVVLHVRPGITDPASITFRREEHLLGQASDPEHFYRTTILPKKLELNVQYIANMSLYKDISLIFKTMWKLVEP